MENKLIDILQNFQNDKNYNELNAVDDILRLFNVVGRSEQLCEGLHCTDFNGKCFKCGELLNIIPMEKTYILKEETSGAYFKSVDEYTFVEKEAKRFESLEDAIKWQGIMRQSLIEMKVITI